jgi:hypothetical protein
MQPDKLQLMTKYEHLLCVGGPHDGNYLDIERGAKDIIAMTLAPMFIDPSGLAKDCSIIGAGATAAVSRVLYVRSYWQAEAGAEPVCVLVPHGQLPRQTLELLTYNYRPRLY